MRGYTIEATKAALSDLRQQLARYAVDRPGLGGVAAVARSVIELTYIVDNVAIDTELRLRALERKAQT